MTLADAVLRRATAYRIWQAPFEKAKLAPVLASGDAARARRVLDVGCGPGTSASHFEHAEYTGLDRDAAYIADARKRLRGTFLVADATMQVPVEGPFDFVLVNSLLHHLDDGGARAVLEHVAALVAEDGHVHVMDLVLPERASPARKLARMDRGGFPRPQAEWQALFSERFEPVVFQPYAIRALGVPLWHMVYFKGKARLES